MSDAQAVSLGMLTPAAGVAAMQGVLLDLAAARSPRAAGVRQFDVDLSSFPAEEYSHASIAPAETHEEDACVGHTGIVLRAWCRCWPTKQVGTATGTAAMRCRSEPDICGIKRHYSALWCRRVGRGDAGVLAAAAGTGQAAASLLLAARLCRRRRYCQGDLAML